MPYLITFIVICGIDLDNWENISADHPAWQSRVSLDIANMEQTRDEAAQRCVICTAKAVLPPSDDQLFPCPQCNSCVRARIVRFGHL